MILVLGTVRLPPDRIDDARSAMVQMIEASRAEPGCIDYAYAVDIADPGLVRVTELWESRAALERHFATPHLQQWRSSWPRLGIGERDLSMFECDHGQPV